MKLLRNFFAGFIAFFLVPLLLTFLFLNNFSRVLLNESEFIGTLKENKTYEIAANEVLPELIIYTVSGDGHREGFPKEVVSQVVSTIDKDKLASDIEQLVTEVYRYTVGISPNLSAQIDITPYTSSLQTQLKPVYTTYLQNLPACTAEQEQALQMEEGSKPECLPQGKTVEEMLSDSEIETLVSDLSVSAPKTLTVSKNQITTDPPLSFGGQTQTNLNEPNNNFSLENIRNITSAVNTGNTYALITIAILLILLVASQFPSFTSAFRWLAWVFVSAAALPLIISSLFLFFVKPNTVESNLSAALDSQGSAFENTALSLLTANVSDLGHKIFQGVQLQALILFIIAAGLFILALVLEHNKKKISEIAKMEEKAGIKVS